MSNALAIVEEPDHVCCRYRVRAFEPALNRQGVSLTNFPIAGNSILRLLEFARLPRFDSILIQRKLLSSLELKLLRRVADRLVFDFDDAVFHRDSYDARGSYSRKRSRRFRATMAIVDTVIAGNDYLADAASKAGASADRIEVIPTCVSTGLYASERPERLMREGIELVWVGSSSTLRGLEARRNLFDRLVREVPGVKLRVICDRFPDLGLIPIVEVPWSEATEAAEIAAGDVGISWIPDDPWSRGKCGLKILQYQAAGLPVLANPVGVHPEMIRPGLNGLLPETDDDWVTALSQLAANPDLRDEMGRNARRGVELGYSVDAWEGTFVAALLGKPAAEQASTAVSELRRDRGSGLFHLAGITKNSGTAFPPSVDPKTAQIEVHG